MIIKDIALLADFCGAFHFSLHTRFASQALTVVYLRPTFATGQTLRLPSREACLVV